VRLPLVSRPRTKKTRAIDTVAGVAKAWSEWHLAKAAAGGVGKGVGAARSASRRSLGGLALLTAVLAAGLVAVRKLRGGGGGDDHAAPYSPGSGPTPPPRTTEPLEDPNAPNAESANGPVGTSPAFPTAPSSTTEDPGAPAPGKDEPEAPAS
jgi:hypothetical protein